MARVIRLPSTAPYDVDESQYRPLPDVPAVAWVGTRQGWWDGTDTDRPIKTMGLLPGVSSHEHATQHVYLATTPDRAAHYAAQYDDPLVLRVDVDGLSNDPPRFFYDPLDPSNSDAAPTQICFAGDIPPSRLSVDDTVAKAWQDWAWEGDPGLVEKASPPDDEEDDLDDLPWDGAWLDELSDLFAEWYQHLVDVAGTAVDSTFAQSRTQEKFSAAYVRARAKQLLETTQDEAVAIGRAAAEAGLDLGQIREFLSEHYDDMAGFRVQRIARTETRRVTNHGRLQAMGNQGVEKFEIVDGGTADSCQACNDRNGKVVDADTAADIASNSHPNCTIDFVPADPDAEVDDGDDVTDGDVD